MKTIAVASNKDHGRTPWLALGWILFCLLVVYPASYIPAVLLVFNDYVPEEVLVIYTPLTPFGFKTEIDFVLYQGN